MSLPRAIVDCKLELLSPQVPAVRVVQVDFLRALTSDALQIAIHVKMATSTVSSLAIELTRRAVARQNTVEAGRPDTVHLVEMGDILRRHS